MSSGKMEVIFAKYRPEYFGIIGTTLIGIGCLVAALGFPGYSLLNHFISELGAIFESPLQLAFNIALIVGAPLIVIFILGTRMILTSRVAGVGRVVGLITGIGGTLVGVFPMDAFLVGHVISAMTFFVGGALTIGLLSVAILQQKEVALSKWMSFGGVIVAACFVAFIGTMLYSSQGMTLLMNFQQTMPVPRPIFWDIAFLEWLPLIGILAWLFFAAVIFLRRKNPPNK